MDQDHQKLSEALRQGNLIPFIGAGVSKAIAGFPSWAELLNHCSSHALVSGSPEIAEIDGLRSAGQIAECFGKCKSAILRSNSDVWDEIIVDVFENPVFRWSDPNNDPLIKALRSLDSRLIITTNYDTLIRDYVFRKKVPAVSWENSSLMLSKLRLGQAVIHLHGRHDVPESMILTMEDYIRVGRDSNQKTIKTGLFFSGILLFVGCSVEGITDDDIGNFLRDFRQFTNDRLPDETVHHYFLCRGKPSSSDRVRLRKFGVIPISYGNEFDDLPAFIESIANTRIPKVRVTSVRAALQGISKSHIESGMADIAEYVRSEAFPGIEVRVGFAQKEESNHQWMLVSRYLAVRNSTRNRFSYPETLAAWALIEGRIFVYPDDLDRKCDFDWLKLLKKYDFVCDRLLSIHNRNDKMVSSYLNPNEIVEKTENGTLHIRDVYQDWVGRQPRPHYRAFVSVPVPVVDRVSNEEEPDEIGVFNIDTNEENVDFKEHDRLRVLELASDLAYNLLKRSR